LNVLVFAGGMYMPEAALITNRQLSRVQILPLGFIGVCNERRITYYLRFLRWVSLALGN
jgi:hypothetical protein